VATLLYENRIIKPAALRLSTLPKMLELPRQLTAKSDGFQCSGGVDDAVEAG
jgi:hypothetical protein